MIRRTKLHLIRKHPRIYLEKKIRSWNLSADSHLCLVYSIESADTGYPINLLRNQAMLNVRTDFVLQLDADFIPCPELQARLQAHLKKLAKQLSADLDRTALVIPAFEYVELPKVDKLISTEDLSPDFSTFQGNVPSFVCSTLVIHLRAKDESYAKSKEELLQLIFSDEPLIQPFSKSDETGNAFAACVIQNR